MLFLKNKAQLIFISQLIADVSNLIKAVIVKSMNNNYLGNKYRQVGVVIFLFALFSNNQIN